MFVEFRLHGPTLSKLMQERGELITEIYVLLFCFW